MYNKNIILTSRSLSWLRMGPMGPRGLGPWALWAQGPWAQPLFDCVAVPSGGFRQKQRPKNK